jgi:hypothetical protein
MCGQKNDGGQTKRRVRHGGMAYEGGAAISREMGMESVPYPINKKSKHRNRNVTILGEEAMEKRSGGTNGKEEWGRRLGEDENACLPVNPRGVATQRKSIRANKRTVNPGLKNRKTKKKRASVLITIAWRRRRRLKKATVRWEEPPK